jgi:hypothetical protein
MDGKETALGKMLIMPDIPPCGGRARTSSALIVM